MCVYGLMPLAVVFCFSITSFLLLLFLSSCGFETSPTTLVSL